ncbi:MAG TPA: HXXEE domain-containing protein [Chitinophagaceae bacterium]|nr:HXXEE domain-containing protein [Chitinophagaceae bacterium]
MSNKIKIAFLLLVLTQAAHSIEEYYGKLWEVYAPAKFITSLVSNDHEKGFVIINIALFIAGILIWLAAIRNFPPAIVPVWVLTILEIINSVGHSVWAVMERDYVPGVATAPVLFILAIYLIRQLTKSIHTTEHRSG